jgi:hypothetical protein
MLGDLATDQVLHFRRTTVILFLAGVLLTAPLLTLYFSGFRLPTDINSVLPSLRASSDKTLVIYHYYERQPHHDNFIFFLERGMHGAADFLFVLNGNVSEEINASLPEHLPNVRVIRRENTCYDLGSYGVVLNQLEAEGKLGQYTAIILMNASVIGPIVPVYVDECWTRIFTDRLSASVGLVGTTISCVGIFGNHLPHVQSMIMAYSPAALSVVRPVLQCYKTKLDAIAKAEITFLSRVLSAGLQAIVLDGAVASPITDPELPSCQWGNVYVRGAYHGVDLNPHDVVFFKTIDEVSAAHLALYKSFMALRNYSSWDRC